MKGKSLNNEPQSKTDTEKTIEVIALLMNLDRIFIKEVESIQAKATHFDKNVVFLKEISRTYYSESELPLLLQNRFSKESETSHMLSIDTFAEGEAERIGAILNKIRNTGADPEYYTRHNTWNWATRYLKFLETCEYKSKDESDNGLLKNDKRKTGRPPKNKHQFSEYLNCSKANEDEIFAILKNNFNVDNVTGIIAVIKALEQKEYFKRPAINAELWDSIRLIFDDKICSNQNFDARYKSTWEEDQIEKLLRQLP